MSSLYYAGGPPPLSAAEKNKCERLLNKAARDQLKEAHYPVFLIAMSEWAGIKREIVTCSFIQEILKKLDKNTKHKGNVCSTYNGMCDNKGIFYYLFF